MNIEVTNIKWSINQEELPTNLVLEEVDLDGFEDVEEFLGMVFYEEYKLEPISYDYQLENKMKKEMKKEYIQTPELKQEFYDLFMNTHKFDELSGYGLDKEDDGYDGWFTILQGEKSNELHHLWINDEDENNVMIMKYQIRTAYDDVLIEDVIKNLTQI